ncbi:aconitase X swivel domain-containing protein [Microbacterium sp. 18062]|uniref:aconitase X swivel domain-containing protein n=1 Tax=Microbacterium sp. 18062 TaxID=2681410 RepID=UPI00135A0E78|nr:DUF126 domain-containing protein [Microbacterium sp. 18062]
MSVTFRGRALIDGEARGEVLRCTSEIPGWGGVDPKTGAIVEKGHPQFGQSMAGRILVIPGAKGASGWSGQFHIAKLNGMAPLAVITESINTKLALGLTVLGVPALIDLPDAALTALQTGRTAAIAGNVLTVEE